MPEANALMGVTAVVVAGLLVWVAIVLLTVKEPWARPVVSLASGGAAGGADEAAPEGDVLEVKAEPAVTESDAKSEDSAS